MPRIILHAIRLTPAIRVDQLNDHKVLIIDTVRFCDSQRITLDGLNGAPDVDNLHASSKQFVCFVGKMVRYTRQRSFIGLIDVHALDWAAQVESIRILWCWAADCVVEDEDAGCAGTEKSERSRSSDGQKNELRVLEQLLRLSVVSALDLVVVKEVFLVGGVAVVLETVAVESVVFLASSDVVNGHGME
jgi:hypothetical protein